MVDYNLIKERYGHMSSWAIWQPRDSTNKEKFGMGDITMFDNPELLQQLNPNIILVGLNISGKGNLDKPFQNFHPEHSSAHDYKTRFALEDTIFWGSYMTDIIKDYEEVISGKVMKYLKENPKFEKDNIETFEDEINCIGSQNPILIAFGNDCYKILNRNLQDKYKIYKVSHYSSCISKEKLRIEFDSISQLINN
jgi:hypothetical protein